MKISVWLSYICRALLVIDSSREAEKKLRSEEKWGKNRLNKHSDVDEREERGRKKKMKKNSTKSLILIAFYKFTQSNRVLPPRTLENIGVKCELGMEFLTPSSSSSCSLRNLNFSRKLHRILCESLPAIYIRVEEWRISFDPLILKTFLRHSYPHHHHPSLHFILMWCLEFE